MKEKADKAACYRLHHTDTNEVIKLRCKTLGGATRALLRQRVKAHNGRWYLERRDRDWSGNIRWRGVARDYVSAGYRNGEFVRELCETRQLGFEGCTYPN